MDAILCSAVRRPSPPRCRGTLGAIAVCSQWMLQYPSDSDKAATRGNEESSAIP